MIYMVKKQNLEKIEDFIKNNPGKSWSWLQKRLENEDDKYRVSRGTFSQGIKILLAQKKIEGKTKKYYHISYGGATYSTTNVLPFITKNLQSVAEKIPSTYNILIRKCFLIKSLRELNLEKPIADYCIKFIMGMNDKFINPYFDKEFGKYLSKETFSEIKKITNHLLNKSIKIEKDFLFPYIFERLVKNLLKISIETNLEDVNFQSKIPTLNNKAIELINELFLLNPDFITHVKKIEDLNFNININFNLNDLANKVDLNFVINNTDKFQNLIYDLSRDEKKVRFENRNRIINKINEESEKFLTVLKQKENYRGYRQQAQHDVLSHYLSFKENIKDHIARNLENTSKINLQKFNNDLTRIFEENLKEFNRTLNREHESTFLKELKASFIKPMWKGFKSGLDVLRKEQNYFQLIKELDRYIERDDINRNEKVKAYIYKSAILCDYLNDYETALDVVERGLLIDKNNPTLYGNMAVIYSNMGEIEKAMDSIKEVYKIDDKKIHALRTHIILLIKRKEFKEAQKIIKSTLKSYSKDKDTIEKFLQLEVFIYRKLAEYEKLLTSLDKLIQISDEKIEYLEEKFEILYYHFHNFKKTKIILEKLIKIDPTEVQHYIALSQILCNDFKDQKQALETVEKGFKVNNKELGLYLNRITILLNLKRFDEVDQVIKSAEKEFNYKFNADLMVLKILMHIKTMKLTEAYRLCKKALQVEPFNTRIICLLIKILYNLNGIESAIKTCINKMNSVETLDLNLLCIYIELTALQVKNQEIERIRIRIPAIIKEYFTNLDTKNMLSKQWNDLIISKKEFSLLEKVDYLVNKINLLFDRIVICGVVSVNNLVRKDALKIVEDRIKNFPLLLKYDNLSLS